MTQSPKHQQALEFFQQGQFNRAAELCEEVLRDEESSELWNDWATVQLACENAREAERGYRRALELDSHHSIAATNLVVLLGRLGRAIEAAPFLEAAAADLDEAGRQAIANLLQGIRASEGEGPATVEAFMIEIGGDVPARKKPALRGRIFDSSSYVKACLHLLRKLPDPLWAAANEALAQAAPWSDYRFGLVVALFHIEAGDHQAALPFLRAACDSNVTDLYAQNLLIDCEVAITEAEGKTHPRFSGLREYLAGSFCGVPWRHFELGVHGDVSLCCEGWLPVPIGNAHRESVTEIWNSPTAQKIRESILDGSFRYCSKIHCSYIAARTLPKRTFQAGSPGSAPEGVAGDQLPPGLSPAQPLICAAGPAKVALSSDRTCNLACPSCRLDFIHSNKDEQQETERLLDGLLPEVLRDACQLSMDGCGEVFVSKPYRRLLKQVSRERYPNLRFNLITNGQLFNRRTFEEFDLSGRIIHLNISMDAATEETYRIVRRGGDFSRLLSNLAFIDELRQREGESFTLCLAFVVWARNFREMAAFVRLGKRFNADFIHFSLLCNLGHLGPEEFRNMNVADPNHPSHGDFLEALEAPEFDDPKAHLGSVMPFRHSKVGIVNCLSGA